MIRLKTVFSDVKPETLYDVLHDPDYRKTWDKHMLESKELGMLNPTTISPTMPSTVQHPS